MLRYESILRRVDGIGVAGFATKEQGNCRVRRVKRRMQSYRGIKYLQATREREEERKKLCAWNQLYEYIVRAKWNISVAMRFTCFSSIAKLK